MPTINKPAQSVISSKKKELASTPTVAFPSDLNDFFMSFQFYDYRTIGKLQTQGTDANRNVEITRNLSNANKANISEAIKSSKDTFARIALPIPLNLVDQFSVAYQTTELGFVAGIAGEALQGANDTWDTLAGKLSSLNSDAENKTPPSSVGANPALAARFAAEGLTPWIQNLADLSFGIAVNPNLAVLFKGPTLKQHSFTWRLAPRNKKESEDLRKIFAILKRAMHPRKQNETTTALLKYPSECLAQFHGTKNNFLYPLRPVVVENVIINHAPNGTLSMFQDTHDVVAYDLTIQLQETSYYTRESFGEESEYGYDGFKNGNNESVNGALLR